MTFETELRDRIDKVLNEEWNTREGGSVPHTDDIALRNGAMEIDAAFLYADLAGSTALQKGYKLTFAAKAIRMYLAGASAIIRHFGGDIKSFDGDRVMGVFMGGSKCNNAVKAAYMINWLVREVINPLVTDRHEKNGTKPAWVAQHGVGIDVGPSFVARAGVRNASGETTHNGVLTPGLGHGVVSVMPLPGA